MHLTFLKLSSFKYAISFIVMSSFLNFKVMISQNYENVYYKINVTNKVIKKTILNGDTLYILDKKAGSKYVDSLKIMKLNCNIYYYFMLPDSLPDGKYSVYYNDKKQNLCFIVKYKNGKKNGSFKFFHYNQMIREIGFYNDNCFDKIRVEYNKNKQVMGVYNYSNCELNGASTTFYSTGEFNSITNYKNGKKDGQFIQYNYDTLKYPNVIYNLEYKDGELINKK